MKIPKITVTNCIVSESDIIFTLNFLTQTELQTASRCHEDIQDIVQENQNTERIKLFDCSTRENFNQVKLIIKEYSSKGYSPLIHIHGHGDKQKGVKLPCSNDYITWDEFINFFSEIKSKEGNLTVIMSCCFSYTIVDLIYQSQKIPLPVAFFYGYKDEIYAGIVQDETKLINDSFLKDGGKDGGKSLMELMEQNNLSIKKFSEYDYMNELVCIILSEYEIGKMRENVVLSMPKDMASFARKQFNQCIRDNPLPFIEKISAQIIQNTTRRTMYMNSIKKQINFQFNPIRAKEK